MKKNHYSLFKAQHPLDRRKEVADKILSKYPDRVPVIVEKALNSDAPEVDKKNRYLVPCDISVGKLAYEIRKHMKLAPEQAIFLFVNGTLPPTSAVIGDIYNRNKDEDGFLYVAYSGESTFGNCEWSK